MEAHKLENFRSRAKSLGLALYRSDGPQDVRTRNLLTALQKFLEALSDAEGDVRGRVRRAFDEVWSDPQPDRPALQKQRRELEEFCLEMAKAMEPLQSVPP